jgi:hypothetical protein
MTCSQDNCTRNVHARGICTTHYQAWLRSRKDKVCQVTRCTKGATAFNLCHQHYKEDYLVLKDDPIERDKFWQFVKKELAL